jgi:hypothetical protein
MAFGWQIYIDERLLHSPHGRAAGTSLQSGDLFTLPLVASSTLSFPTKFNRDSPIAIVFHQTIRQSLPHHDVLTQ